jgi:hypothetical protein
MSRYMPITVEQYHRMIDSGILPEDSSVELLHGLLVRKDRGSPGDDFMGQSPVWMSRFAMALWRRQLDAQ